MCIGGEVSFERDRVWETCLVRLRGFGLSLLSGFFGVVFGSSSPACAQGQFGPGYLPDGPNVPTVTLNEDQSGTFDLRPLRIPPPRGWAQESIWNMQVVGFADDLGRSQSDQEWIENQHGREILYAGSGAGRVPDPLTGRVEPCGMVIYDVTNVARPQLLANIPGDPAGGSIPHGVVCGGDTLPHGVKGDYYLILHRGNTRTGSGRFEISNVTNPSAPTLLTTVVTGLDEYHRTWWECDTGIAYMVAGSQSDGWHEKQHIKIYDLGDPTHPIYVRDWGLVGGQPSANTTTARSCANGPGPGCYEGVANPPASIHEAYSAGVTLNRVYVSYGVGSDGVSQILDRHKLLTGCDASANPNASPNCATSPTQADLLYPQISYITENPQQGAHDSNPIFGVPVPAEQKNFLRGAPQKWNLLLTTSEASGPPACAGEAPHVTTLLDITNDQAPWPISTLNVPQFPGNFCAKGARFGAHHTNLQIYAPYYGRLAFVTWFDAGLRVFDIRDPLNPRPVAYFIQAPNGNTVPECGTNLQGRTICTDYPYMDIVEVDDRGYIYGQDRAGSGITILRLTGEALKVVTGEENAGH
jgi:hypothetical protein